MSWTATEGQKEQIQAFLRRSLYSAPEDAILSILGVKKTLEGLSMEEANTVIAELRSLTDPRIVP